MAHHGDIVVASRARAGIAGWRPCRSSLTAAAVAWALVGATTRATAKAPASVFAAPIFHGTATSDFPEVCGIGIRYKDRSLAACSGTLIAPRVILTAAHCLENAIEVGAVFFPGDGSRLEISAHDWVSHPEYDGLAYADLALVQLGSPAGAILPASPTSKHARRGRARIIGFGADGADLMLRKRVGTVRLRGCPKRSRHFVRNALAESICWRAGRRGADTCVGDSGGPVLVDGVVAGVHSGKLSSSPTGCPGSLAWATDVATFRPWIDQYLAANPGP